MSEKREKIGVQRHIRIADSELNSEIERLREQPGYESANKVINYLRGCNGRASAH